MTQEVSWFLVEPGWTVMASDGKEVGTVHEVIADEEKDIFDGLTISPGLLRRPKYVPAESVGEITEGRLVLTIAADAFERLREHESE